VLSDLRPAIKAYLAACLCVGLLSSCANSPTGKALERTFAADSKLKNSGKVVSDSSINTAQTPTAQLPQDFPTEIPLYPQAQLQKVEALEIPEAQGQLTSWTTSDPINAVQSFYQRAFNSSGWQIISKPDTDAGGTFVVRRKTLQVTLSLSTGATTPSALATPATTPSATPSPATPSQTGAITTKFDIQYIRNAGETTSQKPATPATESIVTPGTPQSFTDLDKLPQELRQHINDLAALGVLNIDSSKAKNNDTTSNKFEPNKTITRREFARWLVAANNRIYANRPGQQIRLASDTTQPAFQDVGKSNPDFASIQALAEAGLIPSPLSGDATAVLFRPDAPLTRENLILWKIPLDTRQALPTASVDAVKQTWGFQDAAKIEARALRAVAADFQNGEQGNIRRVFGYTTIFQPKKPVTRAEAAATIWLFGSQSEAISAKEAQQLKPQKSQPAATPEATPSSTAN
jgi:hypothetical protein